MTPWSNIGVTDTASRGEYKRKGCGRSPLGEVRVGAGMSDTAFGPSTEDESRFPRKTGWEVIRRGPAVPKSAEGLLKQFPALEVDEELAEGPQDIPVMAPFCRDMPPRVCLRTPPQPVLLEVRTFG